MNKTILAGVVLICGLTLVASHLSEITLILLCIGGAFVWYKYR